MGGSHWLDANEIQQLIAGPIWKKAEEHPPSRMAHYTSAEAAISIIREGRIRLRNARLMNDDAEMVHALELMDDHLGVSLPQTREFWRSIDRYTGGRAEELRKLYAGWSHNLVTRTFITSVSEHDDDEDKPGEEIGRLSMWRAYGGPVPVALIVKASYLKSNTGALGAFSFPVAYWTADEAKKCFAEVMGSFLALTPAELDVVPSQEVFNGVFYGLQTIALSLKHPGFREEREWRIVYRPDFQPCLQDENNEPLVKPDIATIKSIPQNVYWLPLKNSPRHGIEGIAPADLIDRVMVGPCPLDASLATQYALRQVLREAGIPDADKKVCASHTPFRVL